MKAQSSQWKLSGSPHPKKAWQSQQDRDPVNWGFWLGKCCITSELLQAKQLIRSTTLMFFFSWELLYNENSCSYGPLVIGSFIMTTCPLMHHVLCSLLVKIESRRWLSNPYSPDLTWCNCWLFPKLKSPLKGKRVQTVDEIQENTMGQLMAIPVKNFAECFEQWKRCCENCVRYQSAYFAGGWSIFVLCTMFLVSCIFFNKCLYFS